MIHSGNPFLPGPGDSDQTRRLRGRLAAGVTIVTSGVIAQPAGLTVSSLMIVEGLPPVVYMQAGPTTDLWAAAADTGRFVAHVCGHEHRALADVFAGLRPSPGGQFATVQTTTSDWGPVLDDLPNRAFCTMISQEEVGWSGLMVARIDTVELSDLADPLVHFRGGYHRLR
jgi:flavin reductase (DIM6/NTAB) family NADH-FMN oxidoreductase RutF